MICPGCNGTRESFAFIDGIRNGKRYGEGGMYPCSTCKGSGEITEDHAKAVVEGRLYRAMRIKLGLTQRDAGVMLGFKGPVEVSQMEAGILPISETYRELVKELER